MLYYFYNINQLIKNMKYYYLLQTSRFKKKSKNKKRLFLINMFGKTNSEPLTVRNKKKNKFSNTAHPFIPVYKDTTPPPQPIDQFAPYLSKKMAQNRTKVIKSDTRIKMASSTGTNKNLTITSSASQFQVIRQASEPLNSPLENKKSLNIQKPNFNFPMIGSRYSIESTFDSIASGAIDTPLNRLVEDNLKRFFNASQVYFYHDISSVQLLYCPSNGATYPHGEGLVGYSHFTRKIQSMPTAGNHVSYNEMYDSKYVDASNRVLIFPIFDSQNSIKAVIEVIRTSTHSPFSESDEKSAEYLQTKFRLYSRWIFQPIISKNDIAGLTHVTRLPLFIDAIQLKMTRLFNCKVFEIWILHSDTNEIFQYTDSSSDLIPFRAAESGVVGYSLLNLCSISLTNVNLHSAYHPRSDGNGDQSILIMPVKDQDSPNIYGLVLRGKRSLNFFTDTDEKILSEIAPLIISSLNSSEFVEKSFKNLEEAEKTAKRLQSMLEVAEAISGQLQIDTLIESIMTKGCDLVNADRCSLFMVNDTRDKLITSFQGGLVDSIEIPINSGIVGYAATTGQILNIRDAYEDPRFNRQTDLKTGYKTKNLLCVPIFDEKGTIRGVTEMINKIGDLPFDSEDEKLITVFNVFVEISIQNARLYRASIDLSLQLRSILDISQKISQTTTLKQVLENILKNARKVIGAAFAMIFIKDSLSQKFDIFANDEDIEAKMIKMNRAKEEKKDTKNKNSSKKFLIHSLLMGEDSKDNRRNPVVGSDLIAQHSPDDIGRNLIVSQVITDRQSRLENGENNEESMIVVPIIDNDRQVLGACLMQWKKNDINGFSQEDLRLLESFSVFISISLERSRMMAIATYGEVELKLRSFISDSERSLMVTPANMSFGKNDTKFILSRDFAIDEFKDFDPDFVRISFCLFDNLHIRNQFHITNEKLFCFIHSIRDTYKNIPYHNWRHAVEVSCFLVYMIVQAKILTMLNPFEILALIVSAFCHDAGHEGYSNNYYTTSESPLAILYNNQSVIETHHCTCAINVLSKENANLFSTLNKKELNKMWKLVIELILSTDMSIHFDLVKEAQELRERGELWNKSEKGRLIALKLLLMAADFSTTARKFEIADKWSDVLCEEFKDHDEIEKNSNFPASSDEAFSKEKFQIDFYTSVSMPLFDVLAQFFSPLIVLADQVKSNLGMWRKLLEEKHESSANISSIPSTTEF